DARTTRQATMPGRSRAETGDGVFMDDLPLWEAHSWCAQTALDRSRLRPPWIQGKGPPANPWIRHDLCFKDLATRAGVRKRPTANACRARSPKSCASPSDRTCHRFVLQTYTPTRARSSRLSITIVTAALAFR